MRTAELRRETKETKIWVKLELDGEGKADVSTGIGFLDHMLNTLARHSSIDLFVRAEGDLYVDQHHTVEDIGICLGTALKEALGDKRGIKRFGFAIVPMDEALALVSIDISGRGGFWKDFELKKTLLGSFEVETISEFFRQLAFNAKITLHMQLLSGDNLHHMIEALFKAFSIALKEAIKEEGDEIPSVKGTL
ncbi:imidazoleglycerol-phosphate dehydratase HisB [bacterium]|nr:imidazoleglycerol-phosphate dehydratase HisB [bacterium]